MVIKETLNPVQELFPHWLINQVYFSETTEGSPETSVEEPEEEATPDDPIPSPVIIPGKTGSGGK